MPKIKQAFSKKEIVGWQIAFAICIIFFFFSSWFLEESMTKMPSITDYESMQIYDAATERYFQCNCLEPPVIENSFGENVEFFNAFQTEIGPDRAYKIHFVRIIKVGQILPAKSCTFAS